MPPPPIPSDVTGPVAINPAQFRAWSPQAANFAGPYVHGTDLYVCLNGVSGNVPAALEIWKSVDLGVTWVLKAGTPVGNAFFTMPGSGPTKIRVGTRKAGNLTLEVGQWDMTTDTYALIGTMVYAPPANGAVVMDYDYDPVSNQDIVYVRHATDGTYLHWRLYGVIGVSGVWAAPLWISNNVGANTSNYIRASKADSDGNFHLVFSSTSFPLAYHYYWRKIKAGGAITAAIALPVGGLGGAACPNHIAFTGNYVVIPEGPADPLESTGVLQATIWVGTPRNADAPVFSELQVSTDFVKGPPGGGGSPTLFRATEIQACSGADGLAYVWWISDFPIYTVIRYCSFDGVTVGPVTTYHNEAAYPTPPPDIQPLSCICPGAELPPGPWGTTGWGLSCGKASNNPMALFWAPPPPWLFISKVVVPPGAPGLFNLLLDGAVVAVDQADGGGAGWFGVALGLHVVSEAAGTGTALADYASVIGGDAAPNGDIVMAAKDAKVAVITNTRRPNPLASTWGYHPMVVLVPNKFDLCLAAYKDQLKTMPLPRRPHGIPKGSEPFRVIGAVPTPLAITGDVLVLTYPVPIGFHCFLQGILHHYTGPGFRDGGGDIEWRLKTGRVFARQMGRMLVQFGKVQSFYSLKDGIPLPSHQVIEYWVAAPNGSGGILPINSQIICGLEGWIFPRV